MKTIIRIEHLDGNGLWTSCNKDDIPFYRTLSFYLDLVRKHDKFPTPKEDGIKAMTSKRYCAFKSIEQIQEWIEPEWFNEIIELGFKILMLEVSTFKEGEYQIVFKKEDIISTKDITSLFVNKNKTK